MKKTYWLLATLPLAFAACATDEAPETELPEAGTMEAPVATEPMEMETGAMASTASMEAIGASNVSGEVIVTPAAGQTEVSVTLSGLEANTTHPGHIHQGSCDAVGSVVVPLSEITADASGSGTMTTTAPLTADSVMAGNHIVVYHGQGGAPIVCGEIEEHVM